MTVSKALMSAWSFAALVAILTLFSVLVWFCRGFFIDDAFISFRYVQQFTSGNGLVYNIGERVEGYSNFLWIIFLSVTHLLGFDLVLAAKALGWMFCLLTIYCVWLYAQRLRFPIVSPLILAVSPPFIFWAVGGLETPLFAFLVTASCLVFLREEEPRLGWASGILFGLLALTRPEGLLFAIVAVGYRLWRLYRSSNKLIITRLTIDDWFGLLSIFMIVAPHYLWRAFYYGYPLPNTVYAKSMGVLNPRAWLEGAYYLYNSAVISGGLLGIIIALLLVALQPKLPAWLEYIALSLLAYSFFIFASGGDWMPMQRFLVHVLPLLALLIHAGLVQLAEVSPTAHKSFFIAFLVFCQLISSLLGVAEQRFISKTGAGSATIRVDTFPMVAYLRQNLSSKDIIAVDLAGVLAYGLPLDIRVIDVNGLADGHIAHQPAQFPSGLFGRGDGFGKWDVDYVLEQNPRFVQVGLTGIEKNGFFRTSNTGQTLLVNDPRFRNKYVLVANTGFVGLFKQK